MSKRLTVAQQERLRCIDELLERAGWNLEEAARAKHSTAAKHYIEVAAESYAAARHLALGFDFEGTRTHWLGWTDWYNAAAEACGVSQ